MAQRSARREGLTPLQQRVVLTAGRRDRAAPEIGALAAGFDVSPPTVSDAVAALVRKGLVERVVGPDARRRAVVLTAHGREVADRLVDWDAPVVQAVSCLDPTDKVAALAALLDVIASLSRAGEIGVARTCTTCRFFQSSTGAEADEPHRCRLLDLPLPRSELRVDCPEHEPAV